MSLEFADLLVPATTTTTTTNAKISTTNCTICDRPHEPNNSHELLKFNCTACRLDICGHCVWLEHIRCIQCKDLPEQMEKMNNGERFNRIYKDTANLIPCIYCDGKHRHNPKYKSCMGCREKYPRNKPNPTIKADLVKCNKCGLYNHNKKYKTCFHCRGI